MRLTAIMKLFLALLFFLTSPALTQTTTTAKLIAGLDTLQRNYFVASHGIWSESGSWNTASIMHMLANLAQLVPSVKPSANLIFETIYQNVQVRAYPTAFGPSFTLPTSPNDAIPPGVKPKWFPTGIPEFSPSDWDDRNLPIEGKPWGPGRWNDDFYAHNLHWAMAWIAAAQVDPSHAQYMKTAISIIDHAGMAWGRADCGGLREKTTVGPHPLADNTNHTDGMATMLMFQAAATMANFEPAADRRAHWAEFAQEAWKFVQGSRLIDIEKGVIVELLGPDTRDNFDFCATIQGKTWTVTQGAGIGGLVQLAQAVPRRAEEYLANAETLALNALKHFSDKDGVVHEYACEWNCTTDEAQYKGTLIRNLMTLQAVRPRDEYARVIKRSAKSIWETAKTSENQFSVQWWGPGIPMPMTSAAQSSAMEAFVALLTLEYPV